MTSVGASKAGIIGFTQTVARELAKRMIEHALQIGARQETPLETVEARELGTAIEAAIEAITFSSTSDDPTVGGTKKDPGPSFVRGRPSTRRS